MLEKGAVTPVLVACWHDWIDYENLTLIQLPDTDMLNNLPSRKC